MIRPPALAGLLADSVPSVSRRSFLGAAGATGLAATLPLDLLATAAGAAPPRHDDGLVLTIFLQGGNDSLNTIGPFGDGTYRDNRLEIAVDPAAAHSVGNGLYFHPSLPYLHSRFRQGDVAVIPAIGEPNADHSHFTSTTTWMTGRLPGADRSTGWMGRWLDTQGPDALGASVDGGLAKQIRGAQATVVGVSRSSSNLLPTSSTEMPANLTLRQHGGGALRPMGNAFGDALADAAAFSGRLQPLYDRSIDRSRDGFVADLQRAAHLLNLGLGVRAISASLGGFDTHSAQEDRHADLLTSLDDAIRAFFGTLLPALQGQTTVLIVSEFGRRMRRNNAFGTDHGTAGLALAVGSRIRGGFVTGYPSLTELTPRGDLQHQTDFRTLYAAVVDTWFGADPDQLLEPGLVPLNLFESGPKGTGVAGFLDVDGSRYYGGALDWAVTNGVITGTGPTTFDPHRAMTRAEFATVLWRHAGSPAPSQPARFTDVAFGRFYTDAVAWMVEQGITTGTGPRSFSPDRPLTRGEVATFLWRYRGRPRRAVTQRFTDVAAGAFYADAVTWMSAEGITTGTSTTTFSPHDLVDRAQAVTFLHRDATSQR